MTRMLPEIPRDSEEMLMMSADGNLPRGYFVATVVNHNVLYVLRGDGVIGRVEMDSPAQFLLRGSIQTAIAPQSGEIYFGTGSTGGEHLGTMNGFSDAFDRIVAKFVQTKEQNPKRGYFV